MSAPRRQKKPATVIQFPTETDRKASPQIPTATRAPGGWLTDADLALIRQWEQDLDAEDKARG